MRQFRYGVVHVGNVSSDYVVASRALLAAADDYELLIEAARGDGLVLVRLDPLVAEWGDDCPVVRVEGYLPLVAWPMLDAAGACLCCGWRGGHTDECWHVEETEDGEPSAPLNDGETIYCVGCGTLWQAPPWRNVALVPDLCDGPCPSCGRNTLTLDIPTPSRVLQVAFDATEGSATSAPGDWRQCFIDVWGDHLDAPATGGTDGS